MSNHPRPRLGISSCLLGNNVRYDGGHKRNESLLDALGQIVDWIPICPEVDIGLGTPRPPIQLVRRGDSKIQLVMPTTGEDLTDRMTDYATRRVEALRGSKLSGYVLKSRSPSCGLNEVLVHDETGEPSGLGVGMFAAILSQQMPCLPIEEEGRLENPIARENFVARICSRARWLELEESGFTAAALLRFHSQHRALLISRDPSAVETLDRLLEECCDSRTEIVDLAASYERHFNEVLRRPPSHLDVI